MLFLVFCKEKCGLQSLKEPLDEGNQKEEEKSRTLPSNNHTNTGPLGTLNGKCFRKHLKDCYGNFPAIILSPASFTGIILSKIKE